MNRRADISYNPETGEFWNKRTNKILGTKDKKGYLRISMENQIWKLHRLAFLLMGEDVPKEVDHKNRDKLDNRWSNLRPCSSSQNQQNRNSKNCYYDKELNSWRVKFTVFGKIFDFGRFKDKEFAELLAYEAKDKIVKGVPIWSLKV